MSSAGNLEEAVLPFPFEPMDTYKAAVSLLRGTEASHVLNWVAMICSLGFSVVGFVFMTPEDTSGRDLLLGGFMFAVSLSWTVANVSRDRLMVISGPRSAADEVAFLGPTPLYVAFVSFSFALSVGWFVYVISSVEVHPEWYGFTALTFLWVLLSVFLLTNSVRDRKDASTFSSRPPASQQEQEQLKSLISISIGTLGSRMLVKMAFTLSIVFSFFWIWAANIVVERKELLSILIFFNATAGFHFGKLLRDLKGNISQEMQSQGAYIVFVGFCFILAVVIPIVAICVMPLQIQERLFLLVGQLMTSSTMLSLTKVLRDLSEQEALKVQIGCTQTTPTDCELTMALFRQLIANGRSFCATLGGCRFDLWSGSSRFARTRA